MKSKRRLRMYFVLLLTLGSSISAPASEFDHETRPNLVCTNDMEQTMSCHFQKNSREFSCSEFTLTMTDAQENCIFNQCDSGCCCSINMLLIMGKDHTATVWKENKTVASEDINITDSLKPKAPTLVSVKESNGNFGVFWRTNAAKNFFRRSLSGVVTYRRKDDTEKVYNKTVTPMQVNGLDSYEILGQELESGIYLVSVKSQTSFNGQYSDRSEELEFKVPTSSYVLYLAVIISLSVAAVVITTIAFVCFVKLKANWWDKCPNPKVTNVHPAKLMLLAPSQESFSSISVDVADPDDSKPWSKWFLTDTSGGSQQQSSGISTASSSLSYAKLEPDIKAGVQKALSEAMSQLRMMPSVTTNPPTDSNKNPVIVTSCNPCGVTADDLNSLTPSGFSNRTYSILIPTIQTQITSLLSNNQTDAGIPCDSAYHPVEGAMLTNDQNAPTCLAPVQPDVKLLSLLPSLMQTDMSYQQCSVDSGTLSYGEDSSSSVLSNINTNRSGGVVSDVPTPNDKTQHVCSKDETRCDQTPHHDSRPADPRGFLAVIDEYQAFQNLAAQPNSLCALQSNGEKRADLDKFPDKASSLTPENFSRADIPNFIPDTKPAQCLFALQRPFINISGDLSASIITDSGYQSV